jgi:hypothetical protein
VESRQVTGERDQDAADVDGRLGVRSVRRLWAAVQEPGQLGLGEAPLAAPTDAVAHQQAGVAPPADRRFAYAKEGSRLSSVEQARTQLNFVPHDQM